MSGAPGQAISGEFELIARVRERLRAAGADKGPQLVVGSGDDAAITLARPATATTVDAFVEGVHFRREWSDPASIGRKALAATVSDLAAMGAEPGEVYVVLGIPEGFGDRECMELLDGVIERAAAFELAIAGGDVTRAPVLTLALTAVGYAEAPERMVRRSGARTGDAVAVTGELGAAAAGLLLFERPAMAAELDAGLVDGLKACHLDPEPRIGAGLALAGVGAAAMIDLSDGLAGDALHICAAGSVGIRIDAAAVPIASGVAEVAAAAGLDPLVLALGGGEDYELLACLRPDAIAEAATAVGLAGSALTVVGEVRPGTGLEIENASDAVRAVAGFDQLAARRSTGEPAE